MRFDGFDWDAGNRLKCVKHGVSVLEIEAVFHGHPAVYPDLGHSDHERRSKVIGRLQSGHWVFLVFTLRHRDGGTFIRPISARFMHAEEVAYYEKDTIRTEAHSDHDDR